MSNQSQGQGWYYLNDEHQQFGPMPIGELQSLARRGVVVRETMVWQDGLADWMAAEGVEGMEFGVDMPPPVVESPAPAPQMDLKPAMGPFLWRRILMGVVFWSVMAAVAGVLLVMVQMLPLLALLVWAPGLVLAVYAPWVAYRKERYEIHDHRVLCHRGGIFGDETTELELRNVTHLKIRLPWLRYKFFGIGHVMVESAGIAKPIQMVALRNPEAVYEELMQRLRKNGFDLTRRELLQEDKPALIGIVLETLGLLLGVLLAVPVTSAMVVAIFQSLEDAGVGVLAIPLLLLIPVTLLTYMVLHILDMLRRTYRVYNDVIVYEEGFLTRENAFIPYENIADARTNRTVIDRIIGVFDVHISCQGSSSEIKFRRLKQGDAMSAAIDRLVDSAGRKQKWVAPVQEKASTVVRPRRDDSQAPVAGPVVEGTFRMHPARVLVPLLVIFPLFPIWVIVMIEGVIRMSCTTFELRARSLRHSFRFLSTNVREFAYDKVTGVVVKRNLWDRMFGTMTVKFWSIGSGKAMEFSHVSCSAVDLGSLLRACGISPVSADPHEVRAVCGPIVWMRARMSAWPAVLLLLVLISSAAIVVDPILWSLLLVPVLFGGVGLVWTKLYHDRQVLTFHEHHVEARQGIISIRNYHVCYRNIKRSKVTRYPGGRAGRLEIFAAGEEEVGGASQKGKDKRQKGMLRQCSFSCGFLVDAPAVADLLNDILCGRVDPVPGVVAAEPLEVLDEAERSLKSALVKLLLTSTVLVPLLLLLPLTLPWTVLSIRRWRYRVDSARVVVSHGVFYRTEEVILLDRVDSLKQDQGPVNKLCGNGNVTIMTAGSSRPDIRIIDCPDFKRIYEMIRDQSR